jgi:hypothetical protein
MYPFSYTGLKIIHDQKVQQALEQHHHYAGQKTHRQNPLRAFGMLFVRFNKRSARKQEASFPAMLNECNCTAS